MTMPGIGSLDHFVNGLSGEPVSGEFRLRQKGNPDIDWFCGNHLRIRSRHDHETGKRRYNKAGKTHQRPETQMPEETIFRTEARAEIAPPGIARGGRRP